MKVKKQLHIGVKVVLGVAFFMGLSVAVAADRDGDGVMDEQDVCPYTLPGTQVDVLGCGLDDDGDGVDNSRDLCPGLPKRQEADETGCPLPVARVVLHEVYQQGRARLYIGEREHYQKVLRKWLEKQDVSGNKTKLVLIKVITDNTGCSKDNLKLAWLRALDFRSLLSEMGISEERVLLLGLGEMYPEKLASPSVHDRRVIVEIRKVGEPLPKAAATQMPMALAKYKRQPGKCPEPDWH